MTINDVVNKIYFYTKTNSTSLPAATMLILINNAYERVASLIIKSDRKWQWDDSNQTDFPVATTALVANQSDYTLATSHLKIEKVEVKDEAGNWYLLKPIDKEEMDGTITDYAKTAGQPYEYDKIGGSVILYPAPDYSQVASLKVHFQRGPALFTSAEVTTGTKVPGFNSLYHDLIPLWASYDYSIANGQSNANQLMVEIVRKEEALQDDYGARDKDDRDVMTMKKIQFI